MNTVINTFSIALSLILILISNILWSQSVANPEIDCKEVFNELTKKLESNYLGYKRMVDAGHSKKYESLKRKYEQLFYSHQWHDLRLTKVRSKSKLSTNNCTRLLQMFLEEFNDGHLFVFEKPEYDLEPKFIQVNVFKENTLLTFSDGTIWGRIDGQPKREVEIINSKDITQPSVSFLNDEATLLTIPSFNSDPKFLQEMLLKNAQGVTSRPKLIIDVRGNRGGNAVYFGFIPVYATQGLPSYGPGEVLASEDTRRYFEQLAKGNPDVYQPVVDRIENNMGEIILGPDYPDRPLQKFPSNIEQVAILTDEGCMSACESFILHSKAMSDKVEVYGTNTAGVIDYTNVMSIKLESSGNQNIYFAFPTSSLSKGYFTDEYPNGYNKTGIRPDVIIPNSVVDKIAYVLDKMDQ